MKKGVLGHSVLMMMTIKLGKKFETLLSMEPLKPLSFSFRLNSNTCDGVTKMEGFLPPFFVWMMLRFLGTCKK